MRIMPLLKAACLSLMLSACVAPLLMMSPTSQLMWALLKPLVGFDPNEANLFEQPLIKDRMTAMLGPNYDTTMQLLKTANELQQEGPLFYVVSRYAPIPDAAKQAGMVWNADTNQLAVMLQKGDGATQVFGENLTAATPVWPSTMQDWQSQTASAATTTALGGVGQAMTGSGGSLLGNMVGSLQQSASKALSDSTRQVIGSAATTAQQQATKAASDSAKQAASSAATTAQQQVAKAVSDSAKQAAISAATTAQQQATQAVTDGAKQAASSTATAQQQATQAMTDGATQAASSAAATVQPQAGKGEEQAGALSDQARADAEAELEKLLN